MTTLMNQAQMQITGLNVELRQAIGKINELQQALQSKTFFENVICSAVSALATTTMTDTEIATRAISITDAVLKELSK